MVGKIKTANKEETEKITGNLHKEICSFYSGEFSGVEIDFHGAQKVITVDDDTMPRNEEEYKFLADKMEEITQVPWDSWGFDEDCLGEYYYIYVEELE